MHRARIAAAVSLLLPLAGCCGGHTRPASSDQPKVTRVEESAVVKADASRIKSVKKVALVSVVADCEIKNVYQNKIQGLGALGHIDDQRSPRTLDQAARKFAEALPQETGWTMPSQSEILANPQYEQLTFDPDLKVQARQTGKPICTGGGYRVLTRSFTKQAGQLATALGVDAVALVWTHFQIGSGGFGGDGYVWSDTALEVVGPDGQLLYHDQVNTRSDYEVKRTLTSVDWSSEPTEGTSALVNAAKRLGEGLKKAVAQP